MMSRYLGRHLVAVATACTWASTEARAAFLRAVERGGPELDDTLWGAVETVASDALELLAADIRAVRSLSSQCLTTAEAAELLDVSTGTIGRQLRSQTIVGIRLSRRWLVPMWQFTPEADSGLMPSLKELQEAFPGDGVALSEWVALDNVELDGRAPMDALIGGDDTAVIVAARSTTAAAT